MKILVADDDDTLRTELVGILREDGHAVVGAADGGEALQIIGRESFDVALLDLRMPKATGLEVLHRLRAVRPETAVVMVTGQGTIDAAVEAMKAGAIDFVEKPYEVEALQRTLRTVQEEQQARTLLGSSSVDATISRLLSDAASRKALLAVVGPDGVPPEGATRILRIDAEGRAPDVFAPRQLHQLNMSIDAHVRDTERPVVFAADLGLLESLHGFDDMTAWVRYVSGKCGAKGGVLVLAGRDRALAAGAQREVGADAPSDRLQEMLESLANPIRRAVVGYVSAAGPVAYSAILKKNFVDSSSKLSFHLQKLQADGLIAKGDAGRYAVTEAGTRAWQVVRVLSDRGNPSLLVATS